MVFKRVALSMSFAREVLVFLVFLLVFLFAISKTFAQTGTIDDGFNPSDLGFGGANGSVYITTIQPDGKIIIGGSFSQFNGVSRNGLARLNADGTLDNAFNPGAGANGTVRSVLVLPDGKIVIAGEFSSYDGVTVNQIVRLNADGSIENPLLAFNGTDGPVNCILRQPDSKVLIVGDFTYFNATETNSIARLNADGTLDNTFNQALGTNNFINCVALQPDGKIIIGGKFTSYSNASRSRIARLEADGTLDNTFNPGNGANGIVNSVVVQPDGKIVIAGGFTLYDNVSVNKIVLVNPDGTIDNTFPAYLGTSSDIDIVALQSDGKIIIGGAFQYYNGITVNKIARLNSDGTLDNTFTQSFGPNNIIRSISQQPDNKIIIAGDFTSYTSTVQTDKNRIARLNWDGSTAPYTPLPVTWLYFKGKAAYTSNQLDWATATEKNSSHFVVQRSLDGKGFEKIGEVQAAGNSNQQVAYTFKDENAIVFEQKVMYYRLKQVDLDGSFEYSAIVAFNRDKVAKDIVVYPNPFSDLLTLNLVPGNSEGKINVKLTTLTGKTVYKQELKVANGNQKFEFAVPSQLASGMYLLRVQHQEKLTVLKVIKQ
jgi:uncharacterized delta-60 repeat protein